MPLNGRGRRRTRTYALAFVFIFSGAVKAAPSTLLLGDPEAPLDRTWTHKVFGEATEYRQIVIEGRHAIRAVGRVSASGLYRVVNYALAEYPWLEWSWRVDRLQNSAELDNKALQDFAAAIYLIFEEGRFFKKNTTVLSYVWTNARYQPGKIVESPYYSGISQMVVVQAGERNLGRFVTERRNVREDYRRAFRREPPQVVNVIALFTDNDQTREPVEAYYGPVRALSE